MPTTNWRQNIREILGLLASEEKLMAYESNVPQVDITDELLCMWFDDLYHPESEPFSSCFNIDELEILARFSKFYEERSRSLPQSNGSVRTWLHSSTWRDVMHEAESTLAQIRA